MNDVQEIIIELKNRPKWLKNIFNLYHLYSNQYLIKENSATIYFDKDIKSIIDVLEIGLKE